MKKQILAVAVLVLATLLCGGCGGKAETTVAQSESAQITDPQAQYEQGRRYVRGDGVEQNWEEGVKWYRLAAAQGSADAQESLGRCYYHGTGVEQDYEKAAEYFRAAAEQGNSAGW